MQEQTIPKNPTGSDKNKPLMPKKISAADSNPIPIDKIPKILIFCCITYIILQNYHFFGSDGRSIYQ